MNDTLSAGFIENVHFFYSFDEEMKNVKERMIGIESQKIDISNKKITILSDNAVLLEDGRTLTGGFAWTFVYSKIDDNWKIIHCNQSTTTYNQSFKK